MTKKHAKKIAARARQIAARARQEPKGGNYQARLRQLGGARGETDSGAVKYVHVHYGTHDGTTWLLNDEPEGALMSLAAPKLELSPEEEQAAFAGAVFPLANETSDDDGKTWVQHLDVEPRRDWRLARRLVYGLLGNGGGRWNAVRIRARSGEELVRHPPRLLDEVAARIRGEMPSAAVTLRAPNDQLFARFGARAFAIATSMKRAHTWPVYVTPIPPPSETSGSWECFSVEDVLATLRWPHEQPRLRVASVDDIRAGRIGSPTPRGPMRKDVLARRLGNAAPDAHYVYFRFDPAKGETFAEAVREVRREAGERADLLEAGVRRMDRPGDPTVCTWKRRSVQEPWTFAWGVGADDSRAAPVPIDKREDDGAFVFDGSLLDDGLFVYDGSSRV